MRKTILRMSVISLLTILLSAPFGIAAQDAAPDLGAIMAREQKLRAKKDLVPEKKKQRDDEILVKFRDGVPEERTRRLHQRHGAQKVKEFKQLRLHHLKLKKGMSVKEAVDLYKSDPDVEYAEPNVLYSLNLVPNDPKRGLPLYDWGLQKLRMPEAWDITTGSSDVVVAVIDTGIDYTHEDLAANIWQNPFVGTVTDSDGTVYRNDLHGIDTFNHTSDPFDDMGHGTHVAGTIGAVGNNGIGITGINWNVRLLACKFIGYEGYGSTDGAIECLQYIRKLKDKGVNIVATNNSWGCSGTGEDCYSHALRDAIDAQRDILFVAAAGNDGADNDVSPHYPANFDLPNVISVAATVGATGGTEWKADFSDFGMKTVHLAAPGVSIYSTLPRYNSFTTGRYAALSGTSMATPHVTGVAALLKAQDANRTSVDLRNLLLAGGDPANSERYSDLGDITITGNRVSAYGSLTCNDRPLFRTIQTPYAQKTGIPQTLSAISINCAAPVGPVTVTLPGGEALQLRDDGIAPDQAANDGIFTATWVPAANDDGPITFSSPLGSITIPSYTAKMLNPRVGHTATLLKDGTVLLVGGEAAEYVSLANAEIYDPATKTFTETGSMSLPRYGHRAVLLNDGRVLIVGGSAMGLPLAVAEIYDPATKSFSPTGSLATARAQHTATLLPDGRVLVAGGSSWFPTPAFSSLEVYDPATNTISGGGNMTASRSFHSATLLNDGRVFIAGMYLAEIYDPATGLSSVAATLAHRREGNTATLLPDGTVLLSGGYLQMLGTEPSIDRFDPATGLVTEVGRMRPGRGSHTATLLPDNSILFAGGYSGYGPDVYDDAEVRPLPFLQAPLDLRFGGSGRGSVSIAPGGECREACTQTYQYNDRITLTAAADSGSVFMGWGGDCGGRESCTIAMNSAKYVTAEFAIDDFVVTPASGLNGSISPASPRHARYGETVDFTVTPDLGYRIETVTGCGGTLSGNRFTAGPVTGNCTVTATFSLIPLSFTATVAGGAGTVTPAAGTAQAWETATFTITPAAGMYVAAVTDNGVSVLGSLVPAANNTFLYTTPPLVADHAISVTFAPALHTIILLPDERSGHTATLLTDGTVLIAGGHAIDASYTFNGIIYDPATGGVTSDTYMDQFVYHTATLLPNGRVLIVGGYDGFFASSNIFVYDPEQKGTFWMGNLATGRMKHTATLLPDGNVLIAGGETLDGVALSSLELIDTHYTDLDGWHDATPAGSLLQPRTGHTATTLANGTILFAGGRNGTGTLATSELYAVAGGTITASGQMGSGRENHTATLLDSGRVLIAGGSRKSGADTLFLSSAEVYNPADGTFTAAGAMAAPRQRHAAVHLPDDTVLVTGGEAAGPVAGMERYNPATGSFLPAGELAYGRSSHTATLLPDHTVLVAGGTSNGGLANAELVRIDLPSYPVALFFRGSGRGKVSFAPAGADCQGFCSRSYPSGTEVTLAAVPEPANPESVFVGWEGGCSGSGGCTVTLSRGTAVTAVFAKALSTVTPVAFEHGSISPPLPQSVNYGERAVFTLVPETGYHVDSVDGCGGALSGATFTTAPVTGDCTVSVAFALNQYTFTATVAGGTGSITPGAGTVNHGDSLTITVSPAATMYLASLRDNGVPVVAGLVPLGENGYTYTLNPVTGGHSFTATFAPMTSQENLPLLPRSKHTATLLRDGTVLLAGGQGDSPNQSATVYDPATRTFTDTGPLLERRDGSHTASLLPDGRVLFAGGSDSRPGTGTNWSSTEAEMYNPATRTFVRTGSMAGGRYKHAAVTLKDGRVLISGGILKMSGSDTISAHTSAELYDPATGTFSPAGDMRHPRVEHDMTLLPDGRVLITGGYSNPYLNYQSATEVAEAEIYDPATGTFTVTGAMASARIRHSVTPLKNGKVLVAGGFGLYATFSDGTKAYTSLPTCELYDPASGTFTPTGNVTKTFGRQLHSAVLQHDGTVLLFGGLSVSDTLKIIERYNPESGHFTVVGQNSFDRQGHTATLLPDGTVLVAGGSGGPYNQHINSEIVSYHSLLPHAEILDAPDRQTSAAGATLKIVGPDVSSYRYTVDDGASSDDITATVPLVLTGLGDGEHTVSVFARSRFGIWQTAPTTATWTVALGPPTATISGFLPSPTNLTTALLTVGGDDVAAYRYRLDAGDYSAEIPLGTPIAVSGLSEGIHTVAVLGKNSAGIWQVTPSTLSWEVDLTPPTVTVSGVPAAPTISPLLRLDLGGDGVVAYKYKFIGRSNNYSSEWPVAHPIQYDNIGVGTYTIQVIGKDFAGNWQTTPTTVTWTVVLPDLHFTGVPASPTNATSATITITDPDVGLYRYKVDNGLLSQPAPTTTPIVLTGLGEGEHSVDITVKMRLTDYYTYTPVRVTWRVDLTPPVAVIGGIPGSPTAATSAVLTVGGTDLVAYRYSLDGGSYSSEIAAAVPISLDSLGEGIHTVAVIGRDAAGNWQTVPTAASWAVDVPVDFPGGAGFRTIQEAYNALLSDNVLRIKGRNLSGTLLFSRNLKVTLRGGYDPITGTASGTTTLSGSLTISNGTVDVENLILTAPP